MLQNIEEYLMFSLPMAEMIQQNSGVTIYLQLYTVDENDDEN